MEAFLTGVQNTVRGVGASIWGVGKGPCLEASLTGVQNTVEEYREVYTCVVVLLVDERKRKPIGKNMLRKKERKQKRRRRRKKGKGQGVKMRGLRE